MDLRTCIGESSYALTYGKSYQVTRANPRNPAQLRVIDDRGRGVWLPESCFAAGEIAVPLIEEIRIRDELAESDETCIEVDLHLAGGERRWCWFATPAALARCGDTIDGTSVRLHYGVPHLIIVSALDEAIVRAALERIRRQGALLRCTQRSSNPDSPSPNHGN